MGDVVFFSPEGRGFKSLSTVAAYVGLEEEQEKNEGRGRRWRRGGKMGKKDGEEEGRLDVVSEEGQEGQKKGLRDSDLQANIHEKIVKEKREKKYEGVKDIDYKEKKLKPGRPRKNGKIKSLNNIKANQILKKAKLRRNKIGLLKPRKLKRSNE